MICLMRGDPEFDVLLVIESMKMEYEVVADAPGTVSRVTIEADATVKVGDLLAIVDAPARDRSSSTDQAPEPTSAIGHAGEPSIRPDLAAVIERHARLHDDARPDAVAKRRSRG